jgi:hypothetical protein
VPSHALEVAVVLAPRHFFVARVLRRLDGDHDPRGSLCHGPILRGPGTDTGRLLQIHSLA